MLRIKESHSLVMGDIGIRFSSGNGKGDCIVYECDVLTWGCYGERCNHVSCGDNCGSEWCGRKMI